MNTSAQTPAAIDLSELFESEGLPAPPLPADIVATMRAHGDGCFASDALRDDWRAGKSLRDIASRWLESGCAQRGARCEFAGHGFHSTFVQVVYESPRCGIFLSRLTSEAFDDAEINRRRVQGSFKLMRRLVDAIEGAPAWPAGKRIALVDDHKVGLMSWGWVAARNARWSDLAPDAVGWVSALVAAQA